MARAVRVVIQEWHQWHIAEDSVREFLAETPVLRPQYPFSLSSIRATQIVSSAHDWMGWRLYVQAPLVARCGHMMMCWLKCPVQHLGRVFQGRGTRPSCALDVFLTTGMLQLPPEWSCWNMKQNTVGGSLMIVKSLSQQWTVPSPPDFVYVRKI